MNLPKLSAGRLINEETGKEVPLGTVLESKGEKFTIMGFRRPHKLSSTGRVFVKKADDKWESQFYPNVFGLKIVDHEFSNLPEPTIIEDEYGNVIGESFGPITGE